MALTWIPQEGFRAIAREVFPAAREGRPPREGRTLYLDPNLGFGGDRKRRRHRQNDIHPYEMLGEPYFLNLRIINKRGRRRLLPDETIELIDSYVEGRPVESGIDDLTPLAEALARDMEIKGEEEIRVAEGALFEPIVPDHLERTTWMIAGPSGSGKSHLAAMLAMSYRDLYGPDYPVVVISRIEKDKVLDEIGIERVKVDASLIDEKTKELRNKIDHYADSVVILDDIDQSSGDKHVAKAVLNLRGELLEHGRHNNTTVITTCHTLRDGPKTKLQLGESHGIAIFPRVGNKVQMTGYLREYAGLEHGQVAKALASPTRWLLHIREAPQYFLHERGAFMVNRTTG